LNGVVLAFFTLSTIVRFCSSERSLNVKAMIGM
jgi:hypothetical protein